MSEATRFDETPRYSQSDLDRAKEDIRSQERDRARDAMLAELKGRLDGLPTTFEGIARRVFDEQMRAMRTENSNQTWRRADTMIMFGQAMIAGAAVLTGMLLR